MTGRGMALAGLQKVTALDYPGLVSAIVFTRGCNFRCAYCHNRHLIGFGRGADDLDAAEVMAFLEKRAGLLDGLVISGGEPCLQPGLADFCRQVKALGYRLKLDTNGSRPEALKMLLDEGLVDYVAMDCKSAPEVYFSVFCEEPDIRDKVEASARLLRKGHVAHEFRTTCVSPYVTSATVPGMAALVGPDSAWFFQSARLEAAPAEAVAKPGLATARREGAGGIHCRRQAPKRACHPSESARLEAAPKRRSEEGGQHSESTRPEGLPDLRHQTALAPPAMRHLADLARHFGARPKLRTDG